MSAGAAAESERRGVAALILLCVVWGYSWIAMKVALDYAGPFYFAALRTLVACCCLFAVMFALKRALRLHAARVVLTFSLFQGVFILFTLLALARGAVGRISVLNFTMPFWVVLLAWPLLGERLRRRQWLILALAFCGLLAVAQPWALGDKAVSALLATCGGLSWALGTVYVKRNRQALQRMDALALTAWQMLASLAPLAALAWLVPEPETRWTWQFIAATAFLGVLGTALAWWLWLYAVERLPTPVASLNTLAIPALAVLLAWIHLGERPNGYESVGMILIAVALVALTRDTRKSS